jgi:HEAT repeat protein
MIPKVSLAQEIQRFVGWAGERSGNTPGDWETYYPHWEELYKAAREFLRVPVNEWDDQAKQMLLFVLARDNEGEVLSSELSDQQVIALAKASLRSHETNAKWQLAHRLGENPCRPETEQLLSDFAADASEYVRRRALLALAECGSGRTEQVAAGAWESADEYQRIAALHSLWKVNSPQLEKYLRLAEEDGRTYLAEKAKRIRSSRPE